MKKLRRWASKCSDGMEAVEGLIILTLMMFVLVFFMSFIFLFYQQALVENVANDTATRIAQSYAYPQTDPVMGFINKTMKVSLSPYRYWGGDLAEKNSLKGEKYARWYLSMASFAFESGEPAIEVRTEHDGLAQRHIVVDITADYRIPMGGILEVIGIDPVVTYHATGQAPCIDLSDYIYTVNMTNALTSQVFGTKAMGMVDAVLALAQNIRNIIASS